MTAATKRLPGIDPGAHRKNLIKLLDQASRRRHLWEVFGDFIEMAALAMANSVDLAQREPREARYMALIKRYEPDEQQLFPKMLGELVLALEYGPDDVLGKVFGELDLGNSARGQFFTPYELCKLMARLNIGDGSEVRERIEQRGFIRMNEPAAGAGAQVIALAEAMQDQQINYQKHLHVVAQDVDSRAVHMAYLQLSLLHIPAVVILGNTLALEEREHWYTPAHVIGLWGPKLRRGYALGSAMDERPADAPPAPEPPPIFIPPLSAALGEQMALF
ncbi:N-6 DNA methylase [Pseudomonas sp. L-22-4S-12]|uniref:N-6 DNA methylase n=1 Tax=Pseudomonas sp. L-22-4S-12 TaxID=2610893 RepID=UPI001324E517|nr:N-6 DNA methylase [Pseudomonas sp. L-22-4S-12]MWV17522.1 N-6 DNA methylase [Pseudomonas sp. L-22-4S-12]